MNSVSNFNIYTVNLRANIAKPFVEQEVNAGANKFLAVAPRYAAINALTVHYNLNPATVKLVFAGQRGDAITYRYFNSSGGIDIVTVNKVGR